MKYKIQLTALLAAAALTFSAVPAQARGTDNQTKATIVGAVAGAALSGAMGGSGKTMLAGAAVGGLAGNAYAYRNKKLNQKDAENQRRNNWLRNVSRRDEMRHRRDEMRHRYNKQKHRRHHRDEDWDDEWN